MRNTQITKLASADSTRVQRRFAAENPKGASACELDPVIHERVRLGIISALAVRESLTFSELKRLMEATDGNLSVHARKLEEANYITCSKSFAGRVPRTEYRITAAGKKALQRYLDQMERIIHQTRGE
ncbi:MAG TPA: transcriptional regulator [Terriglobales bacterium]|nr:transcriptional regulator [Terriglobales bacterium]